MGDVGAGALLVASTAGNLPTFELSWERPKMPKFAPNAMTAAAAVAVTAPAVAIALRRCILFSLQLPTSHGTWTRRRNRQPKFQDSVKAAR